MFAKFAFYGLDMELESEPELFKSRNRNRNHNCFKRRNRNHHFSKVGTGTGTVKNNYGFTTDGCVPSALTVDSLQDGLPDLDFFYVAHGCWVLLF
jgi:hypothetical protein